MKKISLVFITIITLAFSASAFTNPFGLDSYEIYLNNKLVKKHYVNQPLNLRMLALVKAKESDHLQIAYTHCMNKGTGTARSISLKDEKGTTLVNWKFTDGAQAKMSIPVKELLHWQKKKAGHDLILYYIAHESEKEEMISTIRFK